MVGLSFSVLQWKLYLSQKAYDTVEAKAMIGFSSGRFQESWSQSAEGQSRGTDKRFFVARKSIDLSAFVIAFKTTHMLHFDKTEN